MEVKLTNVPMGFDDAAIRNAIEANIRALIGLQYALGTDAAVEVNSSRPWNIERERDDPTHTWIQSIHRPAMTKLARELLGMRQYVAEHKFPDSPKSPTFQCIETVSRFDELLIGHYVTLLDYKKSKIIEWHSSRSGHPIIPNTWSARLHEGHYYRGAAVEPRVAEKWLCLKAMNTVNVLSWRGSDAIIIDVNCTPLRAVIISRVVWGI